MKIGAFFARTLRDLLTQHLAAKFFAVVLAVVVVFLVDRELRVDWLSGVDVEVVLAGQEQTGGDRGIRIVLQPEGQIVIWKRPTTLKLRIRGPLRQKSEFENKKVIVVKVKRSRASANPELKEYQIESEDIDIGFPDAEVEVLGEPKDRTVVVDQYEKIDNVDVTVEAPKKLPAGLAYNAAATTIEPRFVSLKGPRHILARYGLKKTGTKSFKLRLVEPETPIASVGAYIGKLSTADADEMLTMEPAQVTVKPRFDPVVRTQTREFGSLPIEIRLGREAINEMQAGRLALSFESVRMLCTVTLEVSAEYAVNEKMPEEERRRIDEALRRSLHIEIDMIEAIRSMNDTEVPARPVVLVQSALPGVSVVKVEPASLAVTIQRK